MARSRPAKARTRELLEISQAKPQRVDREAGIIYGVKILGQVSSNSHGASGIDETRYADAAMRAAIPLYEGVPVNFDHPPKSLRGDARAFNDRAGKFKNVTLREGDGLYGDLKVFKSDPRSAKLMESAESDDMNDLFACSHHAFGQTVRQGRTLLVTKIPTVKSVDIVTDGGTVRSLFEGRETMKPIIEILEALEARLDEERRPKLKRLLESDMIPEDSMMDAPAEDADPDELMQKAFRAAAIAVLDDDTLDMKGKLGKLKELMTYEEKMLGGSDDAETTDETPPADDSAKEVKESLRELAAKNPEVKRLLESHDQLRVKVKVGARRSKIKRLVESAKLPKEAVTQVFLESLQKADSDAEVKQLIEDRRAAVGVGRPKSYAQGHGAALGTGGMSVKDFAAQVRGY